MIEKRSFSVLSSDGIHNLSGVVYLPDGDVKGLFHVVHGMTEHMARYDKFLTDMAHEGWISFGYDNLGHGKTANDDSELGYIAKRRGWDILAKDVKVYSDAVRKEFGNGDMPYCLMGHSMGSFIVRLSAQNYVTPSRLIVMGTGGPNPAAGAGLALIAVIKVFKGDKHYSKLIDNVAFGSYNKRFGATNEGDSKLWLTNDENVRKNYYSDKYCTFKFSVSAMGDLIRLIKYSNSSKWYKGISSAMPILLVSGEDDPVGNYGKGIKTVESKLKKQGKDVSVKLYSKARHEILNDFTYNAVKGDIIEFCKIKF
ncbi:MAG: alpha/beta hydrolase [Ruminococcaceae bacterium]|nr:alpha/beta hydrolase [Oscillospiraceae bacterium]